MHKARNIVRRCLSQQGWRTFSEEASTAAKPGSPGQSVIEEAALARLKRIKSQLEMSGELPPEPPPASPAWNILRYSWNAVLLGALSSGTVAAYYTYQYNLDEVAAQVKQAQEERSSSLLSEAYCSALHWYYNTRKDLTRRVQDFTDPTYHKLLPDMPPQMAGHVKTLVLDLDDLLVHKEWTRQKGWTVYRRPGVQDFLLEVAQFYELVLYTDTPNTYADPILNRLDPQRMIAFRLYRPETQYHKGKHVRDLSKLNRDLSQVLMLSSNPEAWEFQPENALKLKPWTGDSSDTTLLDLIPFLQMVATRGVRDTRKVVQSYDAEEDVPKAFRQRMQAAMSQQSAAQKPRLGFLGAR